MIGIFKKATKCQFFLKAFFRKTSRPEPRFATKMLKRAIFKTFASVEKLQWFCNFCNLWSTWSWEPKANNKKHILTILANIDFCVSVFYWQANYFEKKVKHIFYKNTARVLCCPEACEVIAWFWATPLFWLICGSILAPTHVALYQKSDCVLIYD